MATIRYRRVPGYYNRSTYHFDLVTPGEVPIFVGTVKRLSSATWNRSASWRADAKDGEQFAVATTRAQAVTNLVRKLGLE